MPEKQSSTDVAKGLLTQILYLAHNAITWGEDKDKTLTEILQVAESAHNALCVEEVIRGAKND